MYRESFNPDTGVGRLGDCHPRESGDPGAAAGDGAAESGCALSRAWHVAI